MYRGYPRRGCGFPFAPRLSERPGAPEVCHGGGSRRPGRRALSAGGVGRLRAVFKAPKPEGLSCRCSGNEKCNDPDNKPSLVVSFLGIPGFLPSRRMLAGTSPWEGIPVQWCHMANAHRLVEMIPMSLVLPWVHSQTVNSEHQPSHRTTGDARSAGSPSPWWPSCWSSLVA